METNESMGALFAALAKAQAAMKNAPLNKTVTVKPGFSYRYSDLPTVREAVLPHLTANDLCVTQLIQHGHNGPALVTVLGHKSGASIESHHPLPAMGKPQEFGSALTYARRYGLSAICGIAADDDDDAQTANETAKPSPAKQAAPEPAKADDRAAQWCAQVAKKIAACKSVEELQGLDEGLTRTMNDLKAKHPDKHKQMRDLFTARAEALSKEPEHV